MPRFAGLDALNAYLRQRCVEEPKRTVAGYTESIGQRFAHDQAKALPLPAHRFDACVTQPAEVDKYQTVGCDQVVFGLPSDSMEHDEVLEMLEVFGTKVIPEFDKDETHSTTRYRATAQRKYPEFGFPVPDIEVPGLPTNALIGQDGTRKF